MTSNYTNNNEKVVIHICEDLERLPMKYPNCDEVYVCHVPESLRSLKPDAFIPHFVGLGPYHHSSGCRIMTRELKLGVAKRVLKLINNTNEAMFRQQRLQNIVFDPQLLYHIDVHEKYRDSFHTLLDLLIVDGLFLLALLHSNGIEQQHTYFLTGKPGMPLVTPEGLEINNCGIIKDVFIIENQIPTYVLNQINTTTLYTDLGSAMQSFCEAYSPLVHLKKLAKVPEDHHHLLDLMYHMVVGPDSDLEPEPEPQLQLQTYNQLSFFERLRWSIAMTIFSLFLSIFLLILIVVYLFRVSVYLAIWLLKFLVHKLVPSVVAAPEATFSTSTSLIISGVDVIHDYLSKASCKWIQPCVELFADLKQTISGDMIMDEALIPSARELHKNSIKFKPAEGGSISSLRFNKIDSQFYLPCIRLDLTSEVIIRNLLAYESLTKYDCLIFAFFIKLMSNLIVTVDDVKLLVGKKIIIKIQLSDEEIVQLFKGLGESVNAGLTKMQKLDQEIKKVNDKFDTMQNRKKMIDELMFPFLTLFSFYYILPAIVSIAASIVASIAVSLVAPVYCSLHPSSTSNLCIPRQVVTDYPWQR